MTVRLFDSRGVVLIAGLRVVTPHGEGLVTELDRDGYVLVLVDGRPTSSAYRPGSLRAVVRPGVIA